MGARTVGVESDLFLAILTLVQEVDPSVLPRVIDKFKQLRNTDFPERGRKEFVHELCLGRRALQRMEAIVERAAPLTGKDSFWTTDRPSGAARDPWKVMETIQQRLVAADHLATAVQAEMAEGTVSERVLQEMKNLEALPKRPFSSASTLDEAVQRKEDTLPPPLALIQAMERYREEVDGRRNASLPYPPHKVLTLADGRKYGLFMTCRVRHEDRLADQLYLMVDERDPSKHPFIMKNEDGQVLLRSNRHDRYEEEPPCAIWVRAFELCRLKRIRYWYAYEEEGRRKEKKFYFLVKDGDIVEVTKEAYNGGSAQAFEESGRR